MNLMLFIKFRLVFLDQFKSGNFDFVTMEVVAIQLRKVIEAVSFSCATTAHLRAEKVPKRVQDDWNADRVFRGLRARNQLELPLPNPSDRKNPIIPLWYQTQPAADPYVEIDEYLRAYRELHRYLHEMPLGGNHPLFDEGFDEAFTLLSTMTQQINSTLWCHYARIGENRALYVDFGSRDSVEPKFDERDMLFD